MRSLAAAGEQAHVLQTLLDAASQDLGDFFRFEAGEPTMDFDGAPYGGARYPVAAHLDGRPFIKAISMSASETSFSHRSI